MEHCNQENIPGCSVDLNLRGLAIATCCHHLCQWKNYISNQTYLVYKFCWLVVEMSWQISFCLGLIDCETFAMLQIRNIFQILGSQRKNSMQLHGLPVGQLMLIMVQSFLM